MVSFENSFTLYENSKHNIPTGEVLRARLDDAKCIMHFCCTSHNRIKSNVTKFPCRVRGHCVLIFFFLAQTIFFFVNLMINFFFFTFLFPSQFIRCFFFSKNRLLDFSSHSSYSVRECNFSLFLIFRNPYHQAGLRRLKKKKMWADFKKNRKQINLPWKIKRV